MSIGICDLTASKTQKLGFAVLVSATLSACVDGEGMSFAQKGDTEGEPSAVVVPKTTQTTLARGAVTLKAPKGFCIDATSVSNGLHGSSALLAKCSSLDGKGAGPGAAVMSVQISPRRTGDAAAPTGQDLVTAALPRRALQTKQKGTLALVQLETGGDEVFSLADPIHWRGATELDTRLVLLALFAPAGSELTSDKGAELLTSFARGLSATRGTLLGLGRKTSEEEGAEAENSQPMDVQEVSATETVEPEKKGGQGLIARLLNRS